MMFLHLSVPFNFFKSQSVYAILKTNIKSGRGDSRYSKKDVWKFFHYKSVMQADNPS